jgi:hypothetical protein
MEGINNSTEVMTLFDHGWGRVRLVRMRLDCAVQDACRTSLPELAERHVNCNSRRASTNSLLCKSIDFYTL